MPKQVKSILTSRVGHIRYHNVLACFVCILKINKIHLFCIFSSDSINLHKGEILSWSAITDCISFSSIPFFDLRLYLLVGNSEIFHSFLLLASALFAFLLSYPRSG